MRLRVYPMWLVKGDVQRPMLAISALLSHIWISFSTTVSGDIYLKITSPHFVHKTILIEMRKREYIWKKLALLLSKCLSFVKKNEHIRARNKHGLVLFFEIAHWRTMSNFLQVQSLRIIDVLYRVDIGWYPQCVLVRFSISGFPQILHQASRFARKSQERIDNDMFVLCNWNKEKYLL